MGGRRTGRREEAAAGKTGEEGVRKGIEPSGGVVRREGGALSSLKGGGQKRKRADGDRQRNAGSKAVQL